MYVVLRHCSILSYCIVVLETKFHWPVFSTFSSVKNGGKLAELISVRTHLEVSNLLSIHCVPVCPAGCQERTADCHPEHLECKEQD